jgi:hypothetical protein
MPRAQSRRVRSAIVVDLSKVGIVEDLIPGGSTRSLGLPAGFQPRDDHRPGCLQ